MNILILAAGLGTRLRPITNFIPKPALPILNIPMIFWNFIYFKNHAPKNSEAKNHTTKSGSNENYFVQNILVNTFHKEDVLRERLNEYAHNFIFSSDGSEVLGTGGGITNNRDILLTNSDFWVVNGDGFFLTDETDFVERAEILHQQTGALCTLIVCEHPGVGTQFGGVWVDANGRVLSIGKNKPSQAAHGYHFTGFRLLSNAILEKMPSKGPHELFDTLNTLLKSQARVEILKISGEFFETGNLQDYLETQWMCLKFLETHKYKKIMEEILQSYCPEGRLNASDFLMKFPENSIPDSIFCDTRVRIFEGTSLKGKIIAGNNITIRENCSLENVIILNNTEVPENTNCSNTVLFKELF